MIRVPRRHSRRLCYVCWPLFVERSAGYHENFEVVAVAGTHRCLAVDSHIRPVLPRLMAVSRKVMKYISAIDRLPGWALLSNASRKSFDDSIPVRMIDLFVDTLGRDELRGGAKRPPVGHHASHRFS